MATGGSGSGRGGDSGGYYGGGGGGDRGRESVGDGGETTEMETMEPPALYHCKKVVELVQVAFWEWLLTEDST